MILRAARLARREARAGAAFSLNQTWAAPRREGFDADGSGAGVEVDEAGAFDAGLEDVEEGLAEAVAGGTGGCSARGVELARAIGSGDDAHRANGTRCDEGGHPVARNR